MTTESKTQQWTPAAMRAARILAANGYGDGFPEQLQVVASTISAETHDAEMAELLRQQITHLQASGHKGLDDFCGFCTFVEQAERLLTQIGGQV